MTNRSLTRRDCLGLLFGLCASSRLQHAQTSGRTPVLRRFNVPIVGPDGTIAYRYPAFTSVLTLDLGEGESLELACIPAGTGQIGTEDPWTPYPNVREPAKTPVRSIAFRPFCLALNETTWGQWIRASRMPQVQRPLRVVFQPRTSEEARHPANEGITFDQAEEYCARVSQHTGMTIRVPSEAEWEYAARAGMRTRFHFGDVEAPEFTVSSRFTPVGSRNDPNRFGLHDLHTGMNEWCADWGHEDYFGAPNNQDPWVGSGDSRLRVVRSGIRGGSATRATRR